MQARRVSVRHMDKLNFDNERDFHDAWSAAFTGEESPVELARSGGAMADRLAWVFASGYQAAMRAVFSGVSGAGWSAFCVSEGRDNLPPVTSTEEEGKTVVSGFKTWVAAATVLSTVIVKVNRGPAAFYVQLPVSRAGVELEAGEPGGFLSEMSQGRCHLADVVVGAADHADTRRLALFGALESQYIYLAFLGMMAARGVSAGALADDLAGWLQRTVETGELTTALANESADIDDRFQAFVGGIDAGVTSSVPGWDRDVRLLHMYSPMIAKRAGNRSFK